MPLLLRHVGQVTVDDVPDDRPVPPASVVVVGAGLAAAAAVAALRAEGFAGHVTVLGAEGVAPYDRPPLSKQLLTRTEPVWLADEGLTLTADDVRLAEPATGLTLDGSGGVGSGSVGRGGVRVTTTAGELRADAAVLATGAYAVLPPALAGARTLHTAADAAALRAELRPGARLVVVGAGWVGAEVAGVAAAAGVSVTVLEAGPAPLAPALGAAIGALTVPWYAAAGVRLLTGTPVVEARADGVRLADGEEVPADVVLAAVGARPSSDWLVGAVPVAADGSIQVDGAYRLPDHPRVVAVGDLARRRSPRHGWVPGGHWDGALRGPAVAARALLGLPVDGPEHDLAPYVFSTQLGHDLGLVGQPGPMDDVVLRGEPGGGPTGGGPVGGAATGGFGAAWFRAGTDELTAVLAVDRPRDVSAARRLFTGRMLPRADRAVIADAAAPLKAALLPA